MSVLYKALQKAEKENEQRHATRAGLDPDRLAESGAIRGTRSRRFNWRVIGLSITGIFVVVMGAAYYLASTGTLTPPQGAAVTPPPQKLDAQNPAAQVPVVTQTASGTPAAPAAPAAPAPPTAVTAQAPAPTAAPTENTPTLSAVAEAPQAAENVPPAAVAEVTPSAEPKTDAKAPATPAVAAKPSTFASAPKSDARGMPQVAMDSPARMLSPPISVKREGYTFAGAGDAIQVRQVSNQAQSDVRSGYAALVNGQYDTALGFYERASKSEPTSVLALLGRGTAYQKLGREEEARAAYEAALKIDPQNREALTNITGLTGQSQPEEALKRLLELEAQHANFSPIPAQIGLTYAKMGNTDAAVDYLRRAITLTPDAPMYHYNLAVVFDRAGQREQAIASYKEVLGLTDLRNVTGLSRVDIQRRVEFLAVQH